MDFRQPDLVFLNKGVVKVFLCVWTGTLASTFPFPCVKELVNSPLTFNSSYLSWGRTYFPLGLTQSARFNNDKSFLLCLPLLSLSSSVAYFLQSIQSDQIISKFRAPCLCPTHSHCWKQAHEENLNDGIEAVNMMVRIRLKRRRWQKGEYAFSHTNISSFVLKSCLCLLNQVYL